VVEIRMLLYTPASGSGSISQHCICSTILSIGLPAPTSANLAAGHSPHDKKGFGARGDRLRQRRVHRLVGQVLSASVEAYHRPALLRHVVTHRALQHGVAGLQGVQNRAQGGLALDVEQYFAVDVGEPAQLYGKDDSNYGILWTIMADVLTLAHPAGSMYMSSQMWPSGTWNPCPYIKPWSSSSYAASEFPSQTPNGLPSGSMSWAK
jgi:hypothetical protein